MERKHAGTCRWAVSTLLQPYPIWLEAAERPWTCIREALPHPIESTDLCATCPHWETRSAPELHLLTLDTRH